MKTASQPSAPHNVGSKIKHLVGKIRRHSNPPPPESSSSASPSSTANPSRESSSCPLPHIGRHSQRNSRRGSASEEDERVHDLELWNAAYDVLRRDHTSSSLVLAYENIISHALPDSLRPGHNGNSDGLPTDGDRRAELMMMIAKSGLEREVKEVSQTDSGDGEAREYVIQTRSIIASLLDDQPSAAIAWAGFCSLTPLLLDPLLRHEDIRQGFVHITNAIPHYMTLHRALHPSSWTSLTEFQRLQPHLHQTLLNLYRRILEYEMNIVCAAASAWNMAARNVVDWHGWKARSDAVRDTDAELMSQVDKSGTDEAKALMEVQRKLDPEGGGRGEPADDTLNHNI